MGPNWTICENTEEYTISGCCVILGMCGGSSIDNKPVTMDY